MFPLQPCLFFPPITSASLKYFLEGSRVSAELKAPHPSHFCFSVLRATHHHGTRQRCQESLSHLFKTVKRNRHKRTRQAGRRPNGNTEGWRSYLSSWIYRGLHHRAQLADKQAIAGAFRLWTRGARTCQLSGFAYMYMVLEGLKNACQGEYPQRRRTTIPTEDYRLRFTWHAQQPFPAMEVCM